MKLVRELEKLAKKKDCTTAQLALGWHLSLCKLPGMPQIIPIPGASSAERVRENAAAVELTEQEMNEINKILDSCEVIGDRYPPMFMKMADA